MELEVVAVDVSLLVTVVVAAASASKVQPTTASYEVADHFATPPAATSTLES